MCLQIRSRFSYSLTLSLVRYFSLASFIVFDFVFSFVFSSVHVFSKSAGSELVQSGMISADLDPSRFIFLDCLLARQLYPSSNSSKCKLIAEWLNRNIETICRDGKHQNHFHMFIRCRRYCCQCLWSRYHVKTLTEIYTYTGLQLRKGGLSAEGVFRHNR